MKPKKDVPRHVCPYNPAIINHLRGLNPLGLHVHDCFAGGGDPLAALCAEMGWTFSGTELEPSFLSAPGVVLGDALDIETYPDGEGGFIIFTSPVYPAGMADYHKINDTSKRYTYRAMVKEREGYDKGLHVNNMGRYGYRGRGAKSKARERYWELATEVIERWTQAGAKKVVVNVKDFIYSKNGKQHIETVVHDWQKELRRQGYTIIDVIKVPSPGMRHGQNYDARIDHEMLIVAIPPGQSPE